MLSSGQLMSLIRQDFVYILLRQNYFFQLLSYFGCERYKLLQILDVVCSALL